jgi:hypothetical protein
VDRIGAIPDRTKSAVHQMDTKPKTLTYAADLAAIEKRIVDALPEIVDGLIGRAKEGDLKAAIYLCNRILGSPKGAMVAPADDRRLPYTEDDLELELQEDEEKKSLMRLLGGSGARNGA